MATIRSTLPSRLRRLLSGEASIGGPSLKVDSETPFKIKALIDKVIQSPLQDIVIPLSGFRWGYDKGNFHHWRPLFLHFDTYFKTYLSCRKDLLLEDNILDDDSPFPKHAVLQILRVMQTILENCSNKSAFPGLEHFRLLLSSTDPEILIASLETLAALVKINPSKLHGTAKLVGCGSVNSCLLSLAQGWGSKEEGLGLYSCVMVNERTQDEGLSLFPSDSENDDQSKYRLGSTLYFELHGATSEKSDVSSSLKSQNTTIIQIPGLHTHKEDDLTLMKQCIERYNVPRDLRFSLLTRIRYAHAFHSPRTFRLYSRICLLAFIVLVQSNDAHDELMSFLANEPEYTNELIRLVRCEETIPGPVRTLAMQALGAQLAAYSSTHERARILSSSSINFAGANRMILLNVLQRAIVSLNTSSDPSSIAFVEAILQFYLLHVISSSNTGGVIRGSGMVPAFLPLLEDTHPSHAHLVSSAVKTLQKLMDYSHTAVSLFKDLGGVEILSSRLQMEVHRVVGSGGADDGSMVIGECSNHSVDLLFSQKRLIRALLKALGSATYTPANSIRSENTRDGSLPATLSLIFSNVDKFGGEIYSSTVTLMNEIIHKDPTCFSTLHELGLPDAFLASVVSGILPSSKALTCVPNGLGAICLNAKGLDTVKETGALRFLVDIFTTKKYVLPMNEAILPLSNAVEELLRHVSPLRSTGVDIIIEIVNRIASFYEGNLAGSSGSTDSSTAMDMDLKEKESEVESPLGGPIDSAAEGISDEQFLQLCTFHVMVLVHKAIENAETCRIFVEKSGIQALLKLLLRPSIFQSSQGMSIVIHSTMVFKSFTQHHSAPLAQSFCSSLRDHLKKAISGFNASSGLFLLDPKATPDVGIFSSLFIVEFLLFLAISKDARWISALLSEFGNGSKDVLVDIGHVQREVLWQIALLEDAKLETKEDASGTATESQQPELSSNENDEQRFNSFRQLIDPLLRRRMSRWSVESQFFELINLYRDLSRASLQQRLGSESPSNIRFGSSSHLHQSDSHAAGVGAADKENDRQKSYYSSCCDMLGSLSSHISHLFQELGKAVLIPTRRRDDTINVSPSSKSVICSFASIAWAHMEFSGHVNPSMSEASVSTKCRYLGKVVDFIDSILLEKSDSCNPVFLNCLYGQGVVESVLTTFQATSQLLFAMHRTPASPMETDDGKLKADDEKEEKDFSWIHGPLTSYGKLMDHLVTSSYILSAHTKHLLEQPLINGDVPFPRDAETFVKVLQSMVLKAVLPVWSHTHFTDCNNDFITSIISIIKHVYSGVEVKNASSNSGGRLAGPPPNETTIASIEEMGFSRARAEEALRQVGANSVELAMEWLFSHPEEPQEDDELARALAMSLGNSGQETKVDSANENRQQLDEEEIVELPPVDELLSTCTKLLQLKDTLAFPVRDLLVMLGSQNDGQYRTNIINFIIGHVRSCSVIVSSDSTLLSSLLHVLALIFHEDVVSREVALKNRFVGLALDLLSKWDSGNFVMEKNQAPKWVTTMFLAIDRLLQVENKLDSGIGELLKKDEDANSRQDSIVIDDEKQNKKSSSGNSQKFIDVDEQKRLIEIACSCITRCLPSETMQAVLQLCATLTRTHLVAISFLDAGGIRLLLSLPTSSLFPGFDNVAATIIRHVLEDPQTLQQAMESEIRQSLVAAANRHSNGRVSPRNFLLNLTSVISRDPVIFMQAAQSVCRVEMVGDRPYVILVKDREKDKCKEKEKDSSLDKEKKPNGDGHGKLSDAGFKNSKVHRKPPQSFINVIELLLDSVVTFVPPVTDGVTNIPVGSPSVTDMDLDVALTKGKGKAVATPSEENEANNQEASAHLAKVVFVLKLLTEILMMYSSAIHVLLRRDAEISSRGTPKVSTACFTGGIFHHVIHKFLPCLRGSKKDKKGDGDWRHKLATRTSQFLVASCVRSTEARRRIFTDISCTFNDFVDSSICSRSPGNDVQAFIDLLNDVLSARTPTGSYISAEASVTFIDAGLVKSLTRTLKVLDLDHPDSSKVVTGLVKALECVTKEHVRVKGLNSTKPAGNSQLQRSDDGMDTTHSMEIASQPNHESITADHNEPYPAVQTYGGSEAVTEDMEHDQDVLEASFAPAAEEDDYMHESSEEARGLENEIDSMGIRIDIQPHVQENIEEDDEDMSGDDGDDGDDVDEDEDEDEEDHNDLEEDEVHHHLPHPDTDQDDHEMDDDEFDEEVLEEDDEDDEDDEDGVILRLDEGINGINVLDHIEVFSTEDDTFPNEALHMMPVEFLGSRRQGRTTSIYNILGRTGVTSTPPRHPLLMEPSSLSGTNRHSEIGRGISSSDRNIENSSQLDTIFRSLRNGRQQGHRLSLWSDDNQQAGGSSTSVVPQGFEELLVSRLRQPDSEKPSEQTEAEPQGKVEANQTEDSEAGARVDTPAESSMEIPPTSSEAVDSLDTAEMRLQTTQETDAPGEGSQTVEMHFEQNDTTIRDAEAVSQESGGSGGTLGESLRSLDVEIGSADGHDDGGERQPSADRVPLGDLHVARPRRTNAASGNSAAAGGRDISLHSVTEVPENPSQEADQAGSAEEQQINGDADSGPIDPAFLDALPEDLRAEVLSAQQSQAAQPASNEQQHTGDIDPEFLAALPPDIRAEVLAQQQTQRSHQSHQSHELEGQPVEMDTVSIIATFPSDIREEVLLTSSDAILANLTPALVAEANMLRERFAHRYHNRTLFGMYPRSRRGESSRRGEVSGSSLDRVGGVLALRNSVGGKVVEADGSPLVDIEALKAMIRLLRVVQPLYKGSLQRLLLNLCAHGETRKTLVEIMMDMLMLDGRKPAYQIDTAEPLYRLYGCQSNVLYSRPQSFDGIPPLVSRRILETLTYLARNHPYVAKILLKLKLPRTTMRNSEDLDSAHGKAPIVVEDDPKEVDFAIALLLSLLNQPLYLRSIAHLEQLLSLLEVVIDNAENKSNSLGKSLTASAEHPPPTQTDAEMSIESGHAPSDGGVASSNIDDALKATSLDTNGESDVQMSLVNLPQAELRLLCSLLGREGLSDNAYTLVAEVLKKLVVMAPTHSLLFVAELADAVQGLTKSAVNEMHMYGEAEMALLNTTSSDGAAILRVLQALSSIVVSLNEKEKDHQMLPDEEHAGALSRVSDTNAALEPLWVELSICISRIESYSDSPIESLSSSVLSKSKASASMPPLPAGSQKILPYIESFFVMCEKLHPEQSKASSDTGITAVDVEDKPTCASPHKPSGSLLKTDEKEKHVAFTKFTERHRKLLNAFIRQNPGLLEKSFSLMLKVPRFIDFDNKRAHFRSKIKHQHNHHHGPLRISVRRAYILEDSYNQLRMRSTDDLKGRLTVHFQGEEGIDAGGLTREWYQLLSRFIFDKGALLFTTVGNDSTFQPNPNSVYQTEHLSYFKFVGRVVGKALFDGQLLDVHFTRSFYKHILEVKVTYHDIEAIDPDYFKNLKWMLENDISDVLDLSFSIDADEEKLILYERTEVTDYELIPNGRNIKVTEENKHQYVDLVAEHRLTTAIRPQINAFLEGFVELIPRDLISIFNDKELELLISGLPDIDLDDMRANTEYSGYSAASPVVQWFWEVVQSFSKEDKARLLQFVTGTSKVPLEGFSALQGISGSQKFQIHKAYGSADHLPSAHTCFNQLDLPEYPSKDRLQERLLFAIHEGSEGFGFG